MMSTAGTPSSRKGTWSSPMVHGVVSKNVNQVDIGDRNVGPGWRLGLAPRLIRPTAASTFDDNPCTDGQIAPFPTSGRTPVVWMGSNYIARSGRLPIIVVQHSTQPRVALDGCSPVSNK